MWETVNWNVICFFFSFQKQIYFESGRMGHTCVCAYVRLRIFFVGVVWCGLFIVCVWTWIGLEDMQLESEVDLGDFRVSCLGPDFVSFIHFLIRTSALYFFLIGHKKATLYVFYVRTIFCTLSLNCCTHAQKLKKSKFSKTLGCIIFLFYYYN